MIVEMTTRAEEFFDEYDCRDFVSIAIGGQVHFSVHDGEPEDNNLGRNFGDCHSVASLMQLAWEAGKDGESFEIVNREAEYA